MIPVIAADLLSQVASAGLSGLFGGSGFAPPGEAPEESGASGGVSAPGLAQGVQRALLHVQENRQAGGIQADDAAGSVSASG